MTLSPTQSAPPAATAEPAPSNDTAWAAAWLDAVADGRLTMSQRRLAAVEARGGVAAVVALARARGLHLLRLTDDRGVALLAAARTPFEVLC